ncbi:hypothetical protein FACS1894185_6080 [Betaproteobacteria bacterium]|nr:hypothetical protein AGMMS49545_06390 [Betaproteobacteria bacterium]GHU11987.1 hypothetical protein FACS1894185_6080 [Betaproteobacteria bacterium]GHU45058.1 hypothetical protein AGMMS50289_15200 [Betaproteobacteria bacterium]
MLIEKDKLPKGASFVLRSSTLELALISAHICLDTSLRHVSNPRVFFEADFWPPNPRVPHERFYIVAGIVPSSLARDARSFLEATSLPQFVSWAQSILALPENSPIRRAKQYFRSEWAHA